MMKYAQRLSKDRFFGRSLRTSRFVRKEDGAFTIFVLFMFLILVALTGIAADFMNYERDRANLQSTLDRAVLAAADLDQTLDPKTVVKEYLAKAGLEGKLKGDPVVTPGFGFRRVEAKAETKINTNFMRLTGTDTLTAIAASAAEESVGSVEIALVLDMSGSMSEASAEAGRTKIDVLQEAAKKFVTLMLARDDADASFEQEEGEGGETTGPFKQEDKVSISIVPYASQVSAGAQILDKMNNVTDEHDYSHCVNFPGAAFSEPHLNFVTKLDRTAHFDPWSETEKTLDYRVCPVRDGSDITPPTDNVTRLHNQIDAMTAKGATSIEIGMKWGAAVLDPSFRNIATQLTTENLPGSTEKVIPAKFAGRPLDYTNDDVLKVIIVMTDGQNTAQPVLASHLRDGMSDVWYNKKYKRSGGGKGEYSVDKNNGWHYWTIQDDNEDHR